MSFNTIGVIILVVLVVYGLYEYFRVAPLITISRELARDAVSFEQNGVSPLHILVAGDSTAVGVGAAPETSVAGRVSESLSASIENLAKTGAKTEGVPEQLSQSQRQSYDLVIIHAGANDIIGMSNLNDLSKNIDGILENAHALSDRVVFLTSGNIGKAPLWPKPFGWLLTARTERARSIIKPLVEESGAVYVDLYALPDPFKDDPQRYYAPDFLHLSGEGYGVWAAHIEDAIQKRWPELYEKR